MSDKLEKLRLQNEMLKNETEELKKIIRGYENVLKLNERELENAEEIQKMYECIVELSRKELIMATETSKARESASELGRDELMRAFARIRELEEENRKLREMKNST
jgi:Ser/Thr protein kinase RdoA (MazF antagonist)